MSETKHTPGTARPVIGRNGHGDVFPNYWTVQIGNVRIADCFGDVVGERDEDGEDKFLPDGQTAANARRLAACWNACDGIPVEALEAGVVSELLEAVKNACCTLLSHGIEPELQRELDDLIAKAEGLVVKVPSNT